MTHSRRTNAIVAVLAAAALATVSACSSSKSAAPADSATAGTNVAGPAGTPVVIGVAAALTGNNASIQAAGVAAAKVWVKYINAKGGVGGHPITLDIKDTKTDGAAGQAAAQQLVENDKAVAMLVLDSVADPTISSYLQTKKVPLLGLGYNSEIYGKLPNVFGSSTSVQALTVGLAALAKSVGAKSFASIVCAEAPVCAQAGPFLAKFSAAAGLKYSGTVTAAASAPDYTTQCVQLINQKVDAIYLGLSPAIAKRVAAACKQQGFTGEYVITSGSLDVKLLSSVKGATFVGDLAGFPWFADVPVAQEFRDAFAKYAPSENYRISTATSTWAALQLFAKALATQTGAISADTVISSYGQVKNENLGGLLPQSISFTANAAGPLIGCYWGVEYKTDSGTESIIPATGTSGNGQTGPLATTCIKG